MKMTYERPVMQAELYQANQYIAACSIGGGGSDQVGMHAVKLGDAIKWYHVPSAGKDWNEWEDSTSDTTFSDLVFGGLQKPMTGTGGADQFYWSATGSDGKLYHLEWSDGWTDKWNVNGNPNRQSGDMVFVLYAEDTNNTVLDACVKGYHTQGWNTQLFPGSKGDNDGGNWIGAPYYDDSLYQFVFRGDLIKTFYSN